jgi:hypothetical protein
MRVFLHYRPVVYLLHMEMDKQQTTLLHSDLCFTKLDIAVNWLRGGIAQSVPCTVAIFLSIVRPHLSTNRS